MTTGIIKINGVVNTENSVLTNINKIADAAAAFFTWDIELGKYSIVLNDPVTTASRTFDDSNIVGSITVSAPSMTETYNSATIRFPHKDLKDDTDFVTVEISAGDRYPNEPDNELTMSTDLVNDPAHAQYLASLELNQSRAEDIIQFSTDFSNLGVKAGEVIAVTSSQYGYNSKWFRVISVKEIDSEDGQLLINIVAQEYTDIWNTALQRTDVNKKTGIPPIILCDIVKESDAEAVTNTIVNSPSVARLTNELFAFQTNRINIPEIIYTTPDFTFASELYPQNILDTGYSFTVPYNGRYLISYFANYGAQMGLYADLNYAAPDGCRKQITIWPEVNATKLSPVSFLSNSITGSDTTTIAKTQDLLDDLNVEAIYVINAGATIDFKVRAKSDFGINNPGADGYPLATSFVVITGRLYYLGETV
jgi:hypothetical protein